MNLLKLLKSFPVPIFMTSVLLYFFTIYYYVINFFSYQISYQNRYEILFEVAIILWIILGKLIEYYQMFHIASAKTSLTPFMMSDYRFLVPTGP